ncbi:hypothetical protein [uncultured Duncaniella sp.]|uniref:hypothetical protein n=1 Tax=uncultured Duncaniella sp. TaxID=2768039 RepID=UPI0025A93A0D|nr:hypothetical protein [uncultured Duncaniella sp.]
MKKLLTILLMMLPMLVGCNKDNKIEQAFSEYAKEQNIPDYKGISNIEIVDSVIVTDAISKIEFQADSVKDLLDVKFKDLTEYVHNLPNGKKQRLATECARIGAEYGEICVNDLGDNKSITALKDAVEELSPYKQPLYIYHIIANVGVQEISFYAFAVGDDLSFVKTDDITDAIRKNPKTARWQEAMMNVIRSCFVPHSMLIDDIDRFMGNGKAE